jgi:hypothetical protein
MLEDERLGNYGTGTTGVTILTIVTNRATRINHSPMPATMTGRGPLRKSVKTTAHYDRIAIRHGQLVAGKQARLRTPCRLPSEAVSLGGSASPSASVARELRRLTSGSTVIRLPDIQSVLTGSADHPTLAVPLVSQPGRRDFGVMRFAVSTYQENQVTTV